PDHDSPSSSWLLLRVCAVAGVFRRWRDGRGAALGGVRRAGIWCDWRWAHAGHGGGEPRDRGGGGRGRGHGGGSGGRVSVLFDPVEESRNAPDRGGSDDRGGGAKRSGRLRCAGAERVEHVSGFWALAFS